MGARSRSISLIGIKVSRAFIKESLSIIRNYIKDKYEKGVHTIIVSSRKLKDRTSHPYKQPYISALGTLLSFLSSLQYLKPLKRGFKGAKRYFVTQQGIEWALNCRFSDDFPKCTSTCKFASTCPFILLLKNEVECDGDE